MTATAFRPWLDRSGRLSPLKLAVFLALFAPGLWTFLSYAQGSLGPRPLTEAIHQTGLWAIRFLMISLAVTPLRRVLQWPRLIVLRRMIGVAAFGYAALHLAIYTLDQAFDWRMIVSEIALRFYLTIGFLALCGLLALAATSTDGMIRRLGGRRWRRLHRLVYVIGVLALIHYVIQSKLDVAEPLVVAGLFLWLMACRAVVWLGGDDPGLSFPSLAGLAVAAGLVTAAGEAIYYHLANHFDAWRVLGAYLGWYFDRRPGWIVLAICLVLSVASLVRAHRAGARQWRADPRSGAAEAA